MFLVVDSRELAEDWPTKLTMSTVVEASQKGSECSPGVGDRAFTPYHAPGANHHPIAILRGFSLVEAL